MNISERNYWSRCSAAVSNPFSPSPSNLFPIFVPSTLVHFANHPAHLSNVLKSKTFITIAVLSFFLTLNRGSWYYQDIIMNQSLLAEEPALPPPPGMHSNFDNSSALKPIFIAALSLMVFLTFLAVGARLVVKIYIIKSMQLEDCQYSSSKQYSSELNLSADLSVAAWVNIQSRKERGSNYQSLWAADLFSWFIYLGWQSSSSLTIWRQDVTNGTYLC